METAIVPEQSLIPKPTPLCPVFGECGGCQYQHISYDEELRLKQGYLKNLLTGRPNLKEDIFEDIVPSPEVYHYRHRLDLKLLRTKREEIFIGFSPENGFKVIAIDACPIAMRAVSNFIPELKRQAIARLPERYRLANLVVKTGDDGRVFWGGIGRRSLQIKESEYLWTEIQGKKIFYSLDTFFQANLSILPELIKRIQSLPEIWGPQTILLDCYGGVGFFGICLYHLVKKVILIEECPAALKLAQFNRRHHQLNEFEIYSGKVEDQLPQLLQTSANYKKVVMVDPPRKGLSASALNIFTQATEIDWLMYVSCHPESLARDLNSFLKADWQVTKIIPFDFFPRTKHLETLVVLKRKELP